MKEEKITQSEKEGSEKRRNRVAEVLGYAAIVVITLLLVFVFVSEARGEIPYVFGYSVLFVKTPSMEPEIPARSYILVQRVSAQEVAVGDVIVLLPDDPMLDGAYNTHRVVEIIGDHREFVTRGDKNPMQDAYTAKAENVRGVYRKGLPSLTSLGRFLGSEIGVMIATTFIFGILLLIYVPDMIRATNRREKQLEEARENQLQERIRAEVERMRLADAQKAAESGACEEPGQAQRDASLGKEPENADEVQTAAQDSPL